MSTLTLETERLALRPLARDDLAAMRRICNDPDVGRYLCNGEPVSTETVEAWLDRSVRDFSEKGIGLFGLRPRGGKELIGFCGFFTFEEGGIGEPELSYGLLPAWWGQGLAIDAAQTCVRYAFEEASFEQVLAGADAVNVASLRVIHKLCMSYIGQIDLSAPDVPYFALSQEDFARCRP